MAEFSSDGFTLAFDDMGAPGRGRPLVLVHGFSSNRKENWRRVGWYDALQRRGARFIAFDARGHGESAKPHDPAAYDRGAMVRDVFALADNLGLERFDLMGYSMGARTALGAALLDSRRIGNLVLGGIGARLFEPPREDNPTAEAMEADDPATIEDPMARSFRQFADEQGEDRLALAACSRSRGAPLERDDLMGIRSTVLVVAGARDDLAGRPQPLADAIPGARAVVLPGCDHFSAIAHTMFKATVFDFLDGMLE
jgi:pimeloyl-ACP methyl ester carboxylesterase